MKGWTRGSLELCWHQARSPEGKRGLVWSTEPIYCAASVLVCDGSYYISESGLHGMSRDDTLSLELYLDFAIKQPNFNTI